MRQAKSLVSCRQKKKNPTQTKLSQQSGTELHTCGGNKIREAARKEISDRNASEGIEPRNFPYQRGRRCSYTGRQQKWVRQGENTFSLSGSKSAV